MGEDIYPIEFDDSIGRAYVKIRGEVNAKKVGNTFLAIAINKSWVDGERSVLWQADNAHLPELFEFSDIFKTTQITQAFTKPGKSAFVVEKSSGMVERVANFYKSIGSATTDRKTEIFFSENKALVWLDT
jgi:hypothetical protein